MFGHLEPDGFRFQTLASVPNQTQLYLLPERVLKTTRIFDVASTVFLTRGISRCLCRCLCEVEEAHAVFVLDEVVADENDDESHVLHRDRDLLHTQL